MFLNPYEPLEKVEFDYAIVDLNLNATYFYELKTQLISLVPDYAIELKHSFPYLLRLSSVEKNLLEQINNDDLHQISNGLIPFLIFKFKSKPTAEPDLVAHLKKMMIYENNGKKYLYRFFDPRVWILLNFFKSKDFSQLNKRFDTIQFALIKQQLCFKNTLNDQNLELDLNLIENIGLINRTKGLLKLNDIDFHDYLMQSQKIHQHIDLLKKKYYGLLKQDLVVILYHMHLLGEQYIESSFFSTLKNKEKGYEQASKATSTAEWLSFFKQIKILDQDLRNKVMYEY